MSMNLADLPPQAREKIASKLEQEERENFTGSKYHNQKAVRVLEDGTTIHFEAKVIAWTEPPKEASNDS